MCVLMLLKESGHKQNDLVLTSVGQCATMVDDFTGQEVRSSGELWSEICSSLPDTRDEAAEENNTEFTDSFRPAAPVGGQENGQCNGTITSSASARFEPMEDSEIYIASLGTQPLSARRMPLIGNSLC